MFTAYIASHILTSEEQDDECWKLLRVACSMAKELYHLEDAAQLCDRKLQFVRTQFVKTTLKRPERLVECKCISSAF